jgi:predicted GNAT family N-acyltransferase
MPTFQIFNKNEILNNIDLIMDFYSQYYKSNYDIAIKNSSHICCCIQNNVIIGACRLITDYSAHTFIVDLVVQKEARQKGIGRQIMKDAIKCLLELDTYFNSISTDPRSPWLKEFYESLGFICEENLFELTYPRN